MSTPPAGDDASSPPAPTAGDAVGALFDGAAVGVVFIDAQGRVSEANAAFAEMMGRSASLAGVALAALAAEDDRESVAAALKNAAPQVDLTPQNAVGRRVRLYFGREAQGRRAAHAVDVTAFKELEEQIVQSRKMQAVGQLAGGVAHDFNNLLTAMIGFCDLLLLRHRAGDSSFADIMQIKQNANRAASLVRQLLAFSRQQTLRPKVMDVGEALTELSHLLRRLIGQSIELRLMTGRDLHPVLADQNQLEQVIINLAVNARDAMESGGALEIRTDNETASEPRKLISDTLPAGDYVRIDVADSGCGIAPETLSRIFEPFFTTKPMGMGTGLGLSTVYGVMRQTGGFVDVASVVGRGTTFSLFLPRSAQPIEAPPLLEDRGDGDDAGAGAILIVEDEDPVRLFAARALRNKGYKVLEARDGESALAMLAETNEPIDLMVTDVVMPGLDGPSLIRMVREQRPTLRVICISGHSDEALRRRIQEAGDVTFLPKPFSLKQLTSRVKDVLDAPAPAPVRGN